MTPSRKQKLFVQALIYLTDNLSVGYKWFFVTDPSLQELSTLRVHPADGNRHDFRIISFFTQTLGAVQKPEFSKCREFYNRSHIMSSLTVIFSLESYY